MAEKRIYVSVPVTEENYSDQKNHVFNVAVDLGLKGWDAWSPFEILDRRDGSKEIKTAGCWAALLECDAVYLCRGWQASPQCRAEMEIAVAYGKEVLTE